MSIMNTMNVPRTRREFERNMNILAEQIRSGRFHSAPGISFKHLLKIRKLPNGRINLLTINEMARLNANMVAHMHDSNFLKEAIDSKNK